MSKRSSHQRARDPALIAAGKVNCSTSGGSNTIRQECSPISTQRSVVLSASLVARVILPHRATSRQSPRQIPRDVHLTVVAKKYSILLIARVRPTTYHSVSAPPPSDIALGAQSQIAIFFASDGETIIDPDPARFFEVPIRGPLPEELNYIP
jgi:hypothetical protein